MDANGHEKNLKMELLAQFFEHYNRKATALGVKAWARTLKDLSVDELENVLIDAIASCDFMPTPEKVRAMSGKDPKAQAQKQWERIIVALHAPRPDRDGWSEFFDSFGINEISRKAIAGMGGLPSLSELHPKDLERKAQDFLLIYSDIAIAGDRRKHTSYTPKEVGEKAPCPDEIRERTYALLSKFNMNGKHEELSF